MPGLSVRRSLPVFSGGAFNWAAYCSLLEASTTGATTQTITATIIGTGSDLVHFEMSTDAVNYTEHGTSADGNYNATGLTPGTHYYWRARLSRGSHYSDYSNIAEDVTPELLYSGRTGITISETIASFDAKILCMCAKIDATHYLDLSTADFGAVASGYIEVRVYVDASLTNQIIFSSSDEITDSKYLYVNVGLGKPKIRVYNLTPLITNAINADVALSDGWHTIRYESVGGHYQITVDGGTPLTVGAGLTASAGSDDGKWMADSLARDNVTVGCLKRSSTTYSSGAFLIDYIDFNGTNKWRFNAPNTSVIDIIGTSHIPWATAISYSFNANANTHFIDKGFTTWTKAANPDFLIPRTDAGGVIDVDAYMAGLGYAVGTSYDGYTDGVMKEYGYPPCLIGFNETADADSRLEIFDRSNTTRQEDISRSSTYYDSTNLSTKSRYHASECLFIDNLMALFKTGYKNRIFPVNDDDDDPTKITGFWVYNEELT